MSTTYRIAVSSIRDAAHNGSSLSFLFNEDGGLIVKVVDADFHTVEEVQAEVVTKGDAPEPADAILTIRNGLLKGKRFLYIRQQEDNLLLGFKKNSV